MILAAATSTGETASLWVLLSWPPKSRCGPSEHARAVFAAMVSCHRDARQGTLAARKIPACALPAPRSCPLTEACNTCTGQADCWTSATVLGCLIRRTADKRTETRQMRAFSRQGRDGYLCMTTDRQRSNPRSRDRRRGLYCRSPIRLICAPPCA